MKKIISLLSMAALVVMGAMITSCNKMEEAGSGHRVNPDGSITFTMTLHMGADTKTDINGTTGAHTFKVGDQIAVAYQNTSAVQVKAVSNPLTSDDIKNDSKSARFTVTLTEEPFEYKGNYVYYTYPASMTTANGGIDYSKLNSQDGTLESLASNLDCCLAYASWNGSDDLPTLTLVNQITIGKFTIKNSSGTAINDDLTRVTISDGSNTYEITPAGGASTFTSDPIWVAMQPIDEGTSVTVDATDGTDNYSKTVTIAEGKSLGAGKITPINVTMALVWDGDLAKITSESTEEFATATDGMTITGTLGVNKKISIAAGATVTLNGATINGTNYSSYAWAGLTCLGDATIILKDGTTNTIKGFYNEYPGIFVPSGKTLIIQGSTGSLNASSNGYGAGIGGGFQINCGNIEIQGGVITATGGQNAAGIGGGGSSASCGTITISGGNITANGGGSNAAGIGTGSNGTCGNITISGGSITANGAGIGAGIGTAGGGTCGTITISGGSITAKGGGSGAGIGTGYGGNCGNITIYNTVTSVTATKGSSALNSIGKGDETYSTCGTVTIGSTEGAITESPYTYPTPPPAGAINGRFTINGSGDQVYFSQGNLQAVCASADADGSTQETWTWQFAEHQWDYIGGRSQGGSEPQTGNNYINGNGSVSTAGTVDLFGWSTNATYYGIHNSENNGTYSDSFKDWGENAITNGGNRINSGWRTLESTEWAYLWNSRDNAANLLTLATVNNVTGLILMPDGWTASGVALTVTTANYTTNNINATDWNTLEQQGCVFLPAGGYRHGTGIIDAGSYGAYWSSTSSDKATSMDFRSSTVEAYNTKRSTGCSVRLVCNAN